MIQAGGKNVCSSSKINYGSFFQRSDQFLAKNAFNKPFDALKLALICFIKRLPY